MSNFIPPHEEDVKFRTLTTFISFNYVDGDEIVEYDEEESLYEIQTDLGRVETDSVNMNIDYNYHSIIYFKFKDKVKEKMMWLEPNKVAFIDEKINYKILTFDEAVNKVIEWNKKVAKIKNFK